MYIYIMRQVFVQKYLNVLTTFKKSCECYIQPNQNSFVYTNSYLTIISSYYSPYAVTLYLRY